MSGYSAIPDRTSSLPQQWTSRQLQIKSSQHELKRKLSAISAETSPIPYQKIRIAQLETDEDEQRHHKELLEHEHRQKQMTDNAYKKAQKESNKRIVSLGNDMWKERQKLRMLEEESSKLPILTADSTGAFTAVLLKLYKDPAEHVGSAKRKSALQSELKDKAITFYDSKKDSPHWKRHWCPISGDYHEKDYITASHIVPYRLGAEIVDYIFGTGSGSRLNTPDNCLLLEAKIEKQFDLGHFVLLPVNPKETPIKRWKVQITNDDALRNQVGNKGQELKDYQGRELVWKNDARPAARFLYYHFVVTMLRNAHYKAGNYEHYCTTLPTGKPFATMGPYLRKSMLLALARRAGDVDETAEALIKEIEPIYDDDNVAKLDPEDQSEVARRVLETVGDQDEEEESDEGGVPVS